MNNGLLLVRMPGALSPAYGRGLWERGGGCRRATTPVVQPTCHPEEHWRQIAQWV